MCGTLKINVSQSSKGNLPSNECEIDTTMPKGPDAQKTGSNSPINDTGFVEHDENGLIRLNPDSNIRVDQDDEPIPQEMSPEKTQEVLDRNYQRLDKMMVGAAKKSYKNVSFHDLESLAANILVNDPEQLGNLQIISRNLSTAMTALDKMKGKDLYTWKLFKGYVVSKEVTAAINAQMDMADAIRVLEYKCDPQDEAALSALGLLRNRCEMRATEISRLAGEMREYIESRDRNRDAVLNRTVKNMLPEMAGKMHGTSDAIQHMKAYVAPLLKTLSDFEGDPSLATPRADVESLRRNIDLMMDSLEYAKKNGVDYEQDYSSPNSLRAPQKGQSSRVIVDVEILDAMMAFLDEKKAKLEQWHLSIISSMMNKFVQKELKTYNFAPILATLDQCPLNNPKFARVICFKQDLLAYMELKKALQDLCKASTVEEVVTKAIELKDKLNNVHWFRIPPDKLAQTLKDLRKEVNDEQTKAELGLIQDAVEEGLFNSLLIHPDNIVSISKQVLVIAVHGKNNLRDVLQKSDLAAIFNGDIDFSVILEARIHGAEDGDVNPDFAPKNLVSRKFLGAGEMNTVEKCEFRKSDGTIITGIFKNELTSRASLNTTVLGEIGKYASNQRNYNLNIASMENAKFFGLEKVIAKCSVGVLEGQYGFFMEEAPGTSPDTLQRTYNEYIVPKHGELSTHDIWALKDDERRILMGNLRRELSNLQWLDIINGQGDRHGDNYFVQFKDDLTVKITGIDNDTSFPVSRLGVGRFDFSSIPESGKYFHEELSKAIDKFAKNNADAKQIWQELIDSNFIRVETADVNDEEVDVISGVDMDAIPGDKSRLREILSHALFYMGLKSLSYPKVIDKRTRDKFLEIYNNREKLAAWKNNMLKRMPEEAVNATLFRFDQVCTYIQTMPAKNVIDGGDWHNQDWKPDQTKIFRKSEQANFLNHDLFDRDFAFL